MRLRLLFFLALSLLTLSGFGQTSIGLIGTATPNGWDSDTNMVQHPDSAHLWSMVIHLTAGEAKFRADDAWTVNWGASDFPSGIGTQDGPNIPIPAAGEFTITFNSQTGAYNFVVSSPIGIIGSATPGGWDDDTNMFHDPVDSNKYFLTLNLTQGAAKFRANDDWARNWGAMDFPSGIGVQNGPDIPIAQAGKYKVTLDTLTGAYNFEEVIEFATIGIIGTATPGGWDNDTDLTKSSSNPDLWQATLTLTDGVAKFRANDAWTLNWGGSDFPNGTGVLNGPDIPVTAGEYLISFNTNTLEYKFLLIGNYASVGIIGDATPGGWDADTDMEQDPNDKSLWKLRIILTEGEAKFRADNDWVVNWGGGDFPTGVATQDGPNIPVPAGEYIVRFNSTTGEYSFEELIIYATVGIVGPATPLASWDVDVDMTKDAVDESFWFINSIDLTDGEAKFRANDAWTVNWGLAQWPTGIGVQDGPNIPITGGTWRVTLNSATGEYAFVEPSSTDELLNSSVVSLSPNPAKNVLDIRVSSDKLQGDAQVIIFNALGARVKTQQVNLQYMTSIDVSGLAPGNYLVHIASGKYVVGKKLVVVK